MIGNVAEFHKKFGLPDGNNIDTLVWSPSTQKFRTGFIQEELDELAVALSVGNRVEAFDALLDIAYVVYGTALFMGIDPTQWHAGMHAVHSANMAKVRVLNAEDSKRGSSLDCCKPDGWVGPEARLTEILSWEKP